MVSATTECHHCRMEAGLVNTWVYGVVGCNLNKAMFLKAGVTLAYGPEFSNHQVAYSHQSELSRG